MAAPRAKCWWCKNSDATTREHWVKASDIRTRIGSHPHLLLLQRGKRREFVQGPKSKLLQFHESLCPDCQSARSQPFDKAYETFSGYLLRRYNALGKSLGIRFDHVYGDNFGPSVVAMRGYLMKAFCCLLVENGIAPPDGLIKRIGADDVWPFELTISVNAEIRAMPDPAAFPQPHLWRSPGGRYQAAMHNGMFEFRCWWHFNRKVAEYGKAIDPTKRWHRMNLVHWADECELRR